MQTEKKPICSYGIIYADVYKDQHFNYKSLFQAACETCAKAENFDYAKKLLAARLQSVSKIAEMYGFSNTYCFLSVFEKQTGYSPSRYPVDYI